MHEISGTTHAVEQSCDNTHLPQECEEYTTLKVLSQRLASRKGVFGTVDTVYGV